MIENSYKAVELRSSMAEAICQLDYWALGFFQEVISSRKFDLEQEHSIECILHLCNTGKDFYDSMDEEFKHLFS